MIVKRTTKRQSSILNSTKVVFFWTHPLDPIMGHRHLDHSATLGQFHKGKSSRSTTFDPPPVAQGEGFSRGILEEVQGPMKALRIDKEVTKENKVATQCLMGRSDLRER